MTIILASAIFQVAVDLAFKPQTTEGVACTYEQIASRASHRTSKALAWETIRQSEMQCKYPNDNDSSCGNVEGCLFHSLEKLLTGEQPAVEEAACE